MQTIFTPIYVPQNYPKKMSGTLTYKIVQKKDYVRKDGTAALYVQIFINGERKKLSLNISVPIKDFDEKNQKVKGKSQLSKDYNLIIKKTLADISNITVKYRLSGELLTLDKLLNELLDPSPRVDFLKFYAKELEKQKGIIKTNTYKQQKSTLSKLKGFKSSILFCDINKGLIDELKKHCKKVLKNNNNTTSNVLKNFKKYLHLANKQGIQTPILYSDISVKQIIGDKRIFLDENELRCLNEYHKSTFIPESHYNVLTRFLFACFTGLRISDIQNLKPENITDNYISFTSIKTDKFQQIKMNKIAKSLIDSKVIFKGTYTDQHINKTLKDIAQYTKIKKRLTFHVARHTFATNYLIKGGHIENLQQVLGHSNVRETMIYVHIVRSIINKEMDNMDDIISL